MATLTIDEKQAKEIYPEAAPGLKTILENSFGGKKFFRSKITDRIKTVQDVFAELDESFDQFMESCVDNDDEKDEVAYKIIKRIAEALNQGWKADWNNTNQRKYYPWFRMSGSGFSFYYYGYDFDRSTVGSRLVFETYELAEYAGKQFESIYKDFLTV